MVRSTRLIPIATIVLGGCLPPAGPATGPLAAPDTSAVGVPTAADAPLTSEAEKPSAVPAEGGAPRIVVADETATAPGVAAPAAPAPAWDIDVESYLSHDRVRFYIERYTGPARDRIAAWLERGRRYEPMIRQAFREAGIAGDMYYLGLVESGYDPHAYSRAAAVGMWQFMTATARGFGLRVDWWVDERRDPVRSTRAAARFLAALNDQFGSLFLAAAAYNGGPGRVSRSLTRYADNVAESDGDGQFFALAETKALRRETSNYVPQLIAAAVIGKEPWKYGLDVDSVPPYAYDSVLVPPATSVAAVGLAVGAPLDSLKAHNPHLLRGVTPPGAESWVRVPVGYAAATFASDLLGIPDSMRAGWTTVKMRKATTLASLAKGHGITSTQLRWYNPRLRGTRIAAGTSVNIPTRLAIGGAFGVADPSIERYGAAVNGVHIVRKGETLSHIAARNGVSVTRLMTLNGLRKIVIYPGQAIRVRK